MVEAPPPERPTVRVTNIPCTVTATELLHFLESTLGPDSVFAVEIASDHKNWKSRGYGRIQFTALRHKARAQSLSSSADLVFKSHNLRLFEAHDDIIPRQLDPRHRLNGTVLHAGFVVNDETMSVLESWEGVRAWVMPERKRVEFWVWRGGDCYKMEIAFENIVESVGCCVGGDKVNALRLKLKFAPKIFRQVSGPNVASKFSADRYHVCKEDFDYLWVGSTDFSEMKSIGHSTAFCWEIQEDVVAASVFTTFPSFRIDVVDLMFEDGEDCLSVSETVPLVKCEADMKFPYEIIFQLNTLVHAQKISLAAVESDLIQFFGGLSMDTANVLLEKLQKLKTTCYDPLSFVKIYCLGPELEKSNYVVKNFAQYASDFMRVTFVEEDWSKLPVNALSTSIEQGFFAKPFRTGIYQRILSILRDGIVIGDKRFEFLAFSASQLRSNSVWMFASNDSVKAEDIRDWMGCFNKIRSVSKCAARMGQLFSSSTQTLAVPQKDVELIPDIETTTDGVSYCFSDGIGKISLSFARQVAQKCGLNHTPSAFQIRYGGYKGVIAVDRNSFRKLSLRSKDEAFEALQQEQLDLLGRMRKDRNVALSALEKLSGADSNNILVKLLLQGYEPNLEPYLSMML
ncbi:hypothetical protein ACLB2K_048968 [Fragaria x ananassa]